MPRNTSPRHTSRRPTIQRAGSALVPLTAKETSTNQLWRNCLLAQLTEQTDRPVTGSVVVLSLREDPHAEAAVRGVRSILKEPKGRLLHASLEDLTEHALHEPALRAWAFMFRSRYLLTI